MQFITTYSWRETLTEAGQKRVLQLFSSWKPSPAVEVKGWWVTSGGGGVIFSESQSASAIIEMMMPWEPYFQFNIRPVIDIAEYASAASKTLAWREGVK